MLTDRETYWCEFSLTANPKNPKGSDLFRYRNYTIIINDDDFSSVGERKAAIIKACMDDLINWHTKHKYKNVSTKEQLKDNMLVFDDSKSKVTIKNFKVRRTEYDLL